MSANRQVTSPVAPERGTRSSKATVKSTVAAEFLEYPELEPVVDRALQGVVSSFYPEKLDPALVAYMRRVTVAATILVYAPIAAVAVQTMRVAEETRVARTAAVERAAANMSASVAAVATMLQDRDDAAALTMAQDATIAANLVAVSATHGGDGVKLAKAAAGVAATVQGAAATAVLDGADAASVVARAAAIAAAEVAAAAEAAMRTVALEVEEAALALRAIALETCFQYATNVAASAAEAVLADGMPDQF